MLLVMLLFYFPFYYVRMDVVCVCVGRCAKCGVNAFSIITYS